MDSASPLLYFLTLLFFVLLSLSTYALYATTKEVRRLSSRRGRKVKQYARQELWKARSGAGGWWLLTAAVVVRVLIQEDSAFRSWTVLSLAVLAALFLIAQCFIAIYQNYCLLRKEA